MSYKYEFTLENGKKTTVNLPFVLEIDSNWEKIRALSFWTKEPETLYWIGDFKSDNELIFWDIGANIGVYSLFCACANQFSIVYAFEPQSTNFLRLMANIHINGFVNISPQFVAMSDKNGFAKFHVKNPEFGSSGGQLDEIDKAPIVYDIPTMTGDVFAEMTHNYPNYIKIDVDGDELKILHGMKSVLKTVTSVLVEANDPAVISYLDNFGLIPDKKYMALRGAGWKRSSNTNIIFTRQ